MQKITPCLWFDTEGEEAANFYCSVFKDSRILDISHYGGGGPRPEGMVMVVEFEIAGQRFTALNGGPEFKFTEAVSLQVDCADQDEVDYYWERLSEGGEQGPCGWLKDKYGLSWQVVSSKAADWFGDEAAPAKKQAAWEAMMQMGKLDLAALQKTYEEA